MSNFEDLADRPLLEIWGEIRPRAPRPGRADHARDRRAGTERGRRRAPARCRAAGHGDHAGRCTSRSTARRATSARAGRGASSATGRTTWLPGRRAPSSSTSSPRSAPTGTRRSSWSHRRRRGGPRRDPVQAPPRPPRAEGPGGRRRPGRLGRCRQRGHERRGDARPGRPRSSPRSTPTRSSTTGRVGPRSRSSTGGRAAWTGRS